MNIDPASLGAIAIIAGIVIGVVIRQALKTQDPVVHEGAVVAAAIMAALVMAVEGGSVTLPLIAGIVGGYLLVGANDSAPMAKYRATQIKAK